MTSETKTWTEQTDKIGWTEVPKSVGELLDALRPQNYNGETRTDAIIRDLSKMSPESIEDGMEWLKSKQEYAISYTGNSYNYGGRRHVILKKPLVKYQPRWTRGANYRGLTSTVVSHQTVMPIKEWEDVIKQHWDERGEHIKAQVRQEQKRLFINVQRIVKDAITDSKRVLTQEEIAEKALSTFHSHLCGNSTSTLGDWSFGQSYSTVFTKEDGSVPLFYDEDEDRAKIEKGFEKITLKEFTSQKSELIESYISARTTLYSAIVDWFIVMDDIYSSMKRAGWKYLRNKEE